MINERVKISHLGVKITSLCLIRKSVRELVIVTKFKQLLNYCMTDCIVPLGFSFCCGLTDDFHLSDNLFHTFYKTSSPSPAVSLSRRLDDTQNSPWLRAKQCFLVKSLLAFINVICQ